MDCRDCDSTQPHCEYPYCSAGYPDNDGISKGYPKVTSEIGVLTLGSVWVTLRELWAGMVQNATENENSKNVGIFGGLWITFCPRGFLNPRTLKETLIYLYTQNWLKNVQIAGKGYPEVSLRLPLRDWLQGVVIVIEKTAGLPDFQKGNPAVTHCASPTITYFYNYSCFYPYLRSFIFYR